MFRSLALSLLIVEPSGSNSIADVFLDSYLAGVGTGFTVSYMEETVVKGKMHKKRNSSGAEYLWDSFLFLPFSLCWGAQIQSNFRVRNISSSPGIP